jgi:hypothetical protein
MEQYKSSQTEKQKPVLHAVQEFHVVYDIPVYDHKNWCSEYMQNQFLYMTIKIGAVNTCKIMPPPPQEMVDSYHYVNLV